MNTSIPRNTTSSTWIFETTLLLSIGHLGLITNFFVIIVIWKTKKFHNTTHYLMGNLAFTDMVVAAASIEKSWLLIFANLYPGKLKEYTEIVCKISAWCMFTSFAASNNTLITLSVERFRLMRQPFASRLSMRQFKFLIFIIWSCSTTIGMPQLYASALIGKLENKCFVPRIGGLFNIIYFTILTFALYVIPLIVMVTLYAYIGIRALKSTMPGEPTKSAQILHHKRNYRVAKACGIITALYMISALPLAINFVIIAFGDLLGQKNEVTNMGLYLYSQIAQAMYLLSSIYNPIIYNCVSKDYRCAFFTIFCKHLSRKKRDAIEDRVTKCCC